MNASRIRSGPPIMSPLRLTIAALRRARFTNIATCLRWASYNVDHPLTLLGIA